MNSPDYHERVLSFMATANNNSSKENISNFYQLFMALGLGHCEGSDGANVCL